MIWGKKPDAEIIYLRSQISDLQAQIVKLQESHKDALHDLVQSFLQTIRPSTRPTQPTAITRPSEDSIFPGSRPNLRPPEPLGDELEKLFLRSPRQQATEPVGVEPPTSSPLLDESEKIKH